MKFDQYMKNMMVLGMSPEEFEAMIRKLLQEERQQLSILKHNNSLSTEEETTFTIKKAAEFLNIPVGDIRKMIKRQDHPIPFMQLGKSLLFRKNKLIAWQEEEEQIAREKVARKNNQEAELDEYLVNRRKKRRW